MTDDVANAILDWISPGDTPRTDGAEGRLLCLFDSALSLQERAVGQPGGVVAGAGVTPQLLFGNDKNRNGVSTPTRTTAAAPWTLAGRPI